MAADKIGKISMFSDFNENWYLGLFWSEELVGALNSDMGLFGNFCVCIQTQSNLVIIIIIIIPLLLFSLWACPTKFSETNDPIYTHLKRCTQVLEF